MSDNTVEIIIKASTAQAAAAVRALSSDVNSQLRQASTVSSGAWATAGRSITSSIKGMTGNVKSLLGHVLSLKTAIVGIGAGYIVKNIVNTAAGFDKMKISLETLTKGEGAKWFKDLNEWAMKMPVNTESAIQSFIMMRAMGLTPTIDQMTTLVDTMSALGGSQDTLEGIARALGQMTSKGKVSAEELMQLAERGVPAMEMLRQKFGDVDTSTLNANEAVQALLDSMKEMYGGQSEKIQSKWAGLTESIKGFGTEFIRLFMESGVMEWLEKKLGGIVAKFDEMYNSGELQAWADIIGTQVVEGLEAMWIWVGNVYTRVKESWPEISALSRKLYDDLSGIWNAYLGLPVWLQEIGLVGALALGIKGRIVVLGALDLIAKLKNSISGFQAMFRGDLGFGEFATMNSGELASVLRELETQRQVDMIFEPKIKMSPPQPWKSGIEEMQADLETTGSLAVEAFDFSPVAEGLANIRTSVSDAVMQISSMPTTISQAMGGYGAPIPEVSQILSGLRDQEVFGGSLAGWLSLGARFDSPGGSLGSYAAGTDYVPRTGIYMLHQGEAVITSGENSKSGKSGAPNVNISGISINVSGANVSSPAGLAEKLADALDSAIAKKIRYGRSNIAAALG